MKPNEVLNFQEYWNAYGYSGDNGEMSARRAFTFAQLQTHRQYLSLQYEVEKLRKQVAAQQSAEKDAPMILTDMPRPWSEGDMQSRPTKRALDGGVCACENVDEANRGTWLVCGQCLKPRRQ